MPDPFRAIIGSPAAQDSSASPPLRVITLIADDDRRDGVGRLIRGLAPDSCIDSAATPLEVLRRLARAPFDLLVLDHAIDGLAGPSLIRHLARAAPSLSLLAFDDSTALLASPPCGVWPWREAGAVLGRAVEQHIERRSRAD